MKAILISIQPKWCELIASGKKTIEVRKTAPKDTPFKVYMYKKPYVSRIKIVDEVLNGVYSGGKVVGDYVCERVTEHEICDSGAVINYWAEGLQHSCLTISQIDEYVGKRSSADYYKKSKISALHIPAVKFYDGPKKLGEFRHWKKYDWWDYGHHTNKPDWQLESLTHAPRGWQYVEPLDK